VRKTALGIADMATTNTFFFDRLLDPVAECFTPAVARQIADLRADAETQARIDELAEKANEGQLSFEERGEYEAYIEAIDFIGILQAQAWSFLAKRGAS